MIVEKKGRENRGSENKKEVQGITDSLPFQSTIE
jgi:hypothetical protein